MGHILNDDEEKQYEEDVENIRKQWLIFIDEKANGSHDSMHNPPALADACEFILNSMFETEVERQGQGNMAAISLEMIAAFGASMYVFGQRSARDGVLSANMLQCHCGTVTDEDIEKLISKKQA